MTRTHDPPTVLSSTPPMPIFDATFYSGKPAGDVLTYSGEHVTPTLAGASPIVLTGLGAFGHNWLIDGVPVTMDRPTFRAFADALPKNATVCLDIEGEPKAVTEILVYALRSGRERRPDCVWGHYEAHDGYVGHMHGDRGELPKIDVTPTQRERLRFSQFVAQECYWRFAIPREWPDYTDLDKARTALHLSWMYHACRRWKFERSTLKVYPILAGTLMVKAASGGGGTGGGFGTPLSMAQVTHAAKEASRWDGLIIWGGAEWSPEGKYLGVLPFAGHGKRWTGTAIGAAAPA